MGLATFKGGVHPYEGKELSEHKPVQILMPKGDLVYPMSQHIGAPAIPLVKRVTRFWQARKSAKPAASFLQMLSVLFPERSKQLSQGALQTVRW